MAPPDGQLGVRAPGVICLCSAPVMDVVFLWNKYQQRCICFFLLLFMLNWPLARVSFRTGCLSLALKTGEEPLLVLTFENP